MKPITIIGNGALGLLFASFFASKNIKVQIITNKESSAADINSDGIFMTDLSGKVINYNDNIYATTDYNQLKKSDIAIILTKAYSTQEAVEKNLNFLKKTETILTLQNGLGNVEILDNYLSGNNIIAGTTSLGATATYLNKTKYCGTGMVDIALVKNRKDGEAVLKELSEIFAKIDVRCNIHNNWKTVVWSKLYVNAIINPITALYKVKNGGIILQPKLKQLAQQLSDEILQICQEANIRLLFDNPFARLIKVCELTSENQSSMLQDVLNHKQLELESITGEFIKKANTLGIRTPANQKLYEKLKIV